jgi:hypothetical protein
MARTKDQARARREESAHRSALVNGRDNSRVGATTSEKAYGSEASNKSESDMARRAAIRERRVEQASTRAGNRDVHAGPSAITRQRTNEDLSTTEGTTAVTVEATSDIELAMKAEGI